ncbi:MULTISPECIES: hypothetical protein [unclassified Rhizobium]|uniref:hypothetical protein n=1 Tax=unclassified Rhizobium TaxID=2613769 RepID=UPI0012E3E257|nr:MULTISPECIES: hypothetical protein [unclassified Rhizobium]
MSEIKIVIKKYQGVWVASIFHDETTEHHGFRTKEEAEDYGRRRTQELKSESR